VSLLKDSELDRKGEFITSAASCGILVCGTAIVCGIRSEGATALGMVGGALGAEAVADAAIAVGLW